MMKRRHLLFSALLASVAFIAIGCTEPNPIFRSWCDGDGCYQCDGEGCMPGPNAPCTGDAQCESGEICTNVGCAAACDDSSQCGAGLVCTSGFCVAAGFQTVKVYEPAKTCAKDEDCSSDEYCKSGKCVPRCKSDDECAPGNVCIACGKCQPKDTPATCGEVPSFCDGDAACGANKRCLTGRCHFECESTESCPVGQVCSASVCSDDPSPASPSCVLDIDCDSGSCINGYCHAFCETSGECGSGMLCQMGVCRADYHPAK